MPEKKFTDHSEADAIADEAWVSVIQKMDETYADLVHYQVEIEQKKS